MISISVCVPGSVPNPRCMPTGLRPAKNFCANFSLIITVVGILSKSSVALARLTIRLSVRRKSRPATMGTPSVAKYPGPTWFMYACGWSSGLVGEYPSAVNPLSHSLSSMIRIDATATDFTPRSEEHTSELQSRLHLVCRLLLEKKKKHSHTKTVNNNINGVKHQSV